MALVGLFGGFGPAKCAKGCVNQGQMWLFMGVLRLFSGRWMEIWVRCGVNWPRNVENEVPTAVNELPDGANELPDVANEAPDVVNEAPDLANEVPTGANEAPAGENEVPDAAREVHFMKNEARSAVIGRPSVLAEAPVAGDEVAEPKGGGLGRVFWFWPVGGFRGRAFFAAGFGRLPGGRSVWSRAAFMGSVAGLLDGVYAGFWQVCFFRPWRFFGVGCGPFAMRSFFQGAAGGGFCDGAERRNLGMLIFTALLSRFSFAERLGLRRR